jgi:hypothetical protein
MTVSQEGLRSVDLDQITRNYAYVRRMWARLNRNHGINLSSYFFFGLPFIAWGHILRDSILLQERETR